MNSLKIEDTVGFIIKYFLEMKRNRSISWCRQLVASHVGGLGSIQRLIHVKFFVDKDSLGEFVSPGSISSSHCSKITCLLSAPNTV